MSQRPPLDWRLILMGLPKRRFSATELKRAIPEPPGRSLRIAVVINVLLMLATFTLAFGRDRHLALLLMLLPLALGVPAALWAVWRDPGSRVARWIYYLLPVALGMGVALLSKQSSDLRRDEVMVVMAMAVAASLTLWFAIVYRHQYVELRLRELDEQARAVAMARRLSAAQIQPHFLFNTLASLQHWVQAKDDRAAPMLQALTGYLRATLPMFERERLPLADEVQAARRYLEVMQLRLGGQLAFAIDAQAEAAGAQVPPGLLLTLVENAVEHGVQPSLHGARVTLHARRDGQRLVVEVGDDGAGLDPAAVDGVGLVNVRQRLAQAFGDAATLTLDGGPSRGCRARLTLPFTTATERP